MGRDNSSTMTPEYYTVAAEMDGSGSATRINTIHHTTFKHLNKVFHDHKKTRLLIVTVHGQHGFYVIDLWHNEITPHSPYVAPAFVGDVNVTTGEAYRRRFDDIDLAIGWCALTIHEINETNVVIAYT